MKQQHRIFLRFSILALFFLGCLASPLTRRKLNGTKEFIKVDDALLRYKFFPMAAAAYSDKPEDCVRHTFKNAVVHRKVKRLCGDGYQEPENCFGFTAILHDEKAILLSFRGTHGLLQLAYEFDRSVFKPKANTTAGGQVGAYFYYVYTTVMDNGLKQSLRELINYYKDYDVWVTGHSLGGALASIGAAEIVAQNWVDGDRVKLVTFGQPRTGDQEFAAAHDRLVEFSYRVTHASDIVPHLPYEYFEGYYHHKNEIWYNNDMTLGKPFVECDEDESEKCSNGKYWKFSVIDHLYYYNAFITGYGFNGCI